ncbi:MFS transporter [Achromobacter xylosoxidans]
MTVELRARRPVLPLGLFRDRGYAVTNFASFVLGFSGYSSLFFFSLYLQQVQGLSPLAAGSQLAPQFIASGIASTVFGKLNPRFGLPRLMIAGYALIGAAMLGMTGLDAHTPYALTCALMVLLGVGSGLALPATSMAVMATVPRERSGMASATMNALRQSGMTIGIALLGALMSARAVDALNGALARQGLPDALALARAAVLRHELPLAAGDARALLADALAGGFSLAMAVAGAASLALRRHARAGGSRREAGAARGLKPRRRASAKNPACRHGWRLITHRDFKARNLRPPLLKHR